MLKKQFIEIVVVLTLLIINVVVVIEALKASKDVFLEKPVATNVKDTKELVKTERELGKRVLILEQNAIKDSI